MSPAILASVAGPLVSGLFGLRNNGRAPGVDYKKLRRDAEAAGFNPLTALMAGGGAGYQRTFDPALSSASFLGEAISRGVETYFNVRQGERDAEALAIERQRMAHEAASASAARRVPATYGYDLTQQVAPASPRTGGGPALPPSGTVRPMSRPVVPGQYRDRVPVFGSGGARAYILPDVAARLGLSAFDTLMPGDWAELVGELGEFETGVDQMRVRDVQLRQPVYENIAPRLSWDMFSFGLPSLLSGAAAPAPVVLPPLPPVALPSQSYPPALWSMPWGH